MNDDYSYPTYNKGKLISKKEGGKTKKEKGVTRKKYGKYTKYNKNLAIRSI